MQLHGPCTPADDPRYQSLTADSGSHLPSIGVPGAWLLQIRPTLAVSQSKGLIEGGEEPAQGDAQCSGQSIHDIDGWCLLPAFEVTHIGPVKTRTVG